MKDLLHLPELLSMVSMLRVEPLQAALLQGRSSMASATNKATAAK